MPLDSAPYRDLVRQNAAREVKSLGNLEHASGWLQLAECCIHCRSHGSLSLDFRVASRPRKCSALQWNATRRLLDAGTYFYFPPRCILRGPSKKRHLVDVGLA